LPLVVIQDEGSLGEQQWFSSAGHVQGVDSGRDTDFLRFHTTPSLVLAILRTTGFIEDVQRRVVLEPKALCVLDLYSGILMRIKDPMSPRLFEDFLEVVEQLPHSNIGIATLG
ncbi:hypothetical protein MTR67_038832, partial [Solanum verrucosum]